MRRREGRVLCEESIAGPLLMDRAGLLARCGEAAYATGDPARAAQLVRQAIALVDAARQPQRAGLLHEQLARRLRMLDDPGALKEQQEAVRLGATRAVGRAGAGARLAHAAAGTGASLRGARGLAEGAVAIAEQVGARNEEANARTTLGSALIHWPGRPAT